MKIKPLSIVVSVIVVGALIAGAKYAERLYAPEMERMDRLRAECEKQLPPNDHPRLAEVQKQVDQCVSNKIHGRN